MLALPAAPNLLQRWGGDPPHTLCRCSFQNLSTPCILLPAPHRTASLPAAWRTGVTLEDVRLRVEALEYLQLPVAVQSGRIGRLSFQVLPTLDGAG